MFAGAALNLRQVADAPAYRGFMAPQAPRLPAAAQVGVAWAVCQGDESAGRPETVPGVVLLVAACREEFCTFLGDFATWPFGIKLRLFQAEIVDIEPEHVRAPVDHFISDIERLEGVA